MFRINVYTEREERMRAARRGMAQLAVYATVLGANALMIIFLIVSGRLLEGREAAILREVERINGQVTAPAVQPADLALARELFAVRRDRLEWAPLLAAVSQAIPREIFLDELRGQAAHRRGTAGLQLSGATHDRTADVGEVSQFVEALRGDVGLTDVFPNVRLESMNSGTGGFQLTCEPAGD